MNEKVTCLVAINSEKAYRDFYEAWKDELSDINILIVENNAGHTFECRTENTTHLSWVDIDRDLGKNYWIIPRNCSSILSYGCYKAAKDSDIIILLDENARPGKEEVIQKHLELMSQTQKESAWTNILTNIKPKGVPFHNVNRKVPLYMNHGLWTENAVLDAATELSLNQNSPEITCNSTLIPKGHYFSMSSINLAIRKEIAPLMYFLLMGEDYPFENFGDIWAGVIAKKIMDHLNMGCRSGEPFVKNYRQVDIWKSLRAESNTLPVNESLWEKIDAAVLTASTPATCYAQIAGLISNWGHPYFQKLSRAMKIWSGLYTGETVHEPVDENEVKSPGQLLSYIKEEPQKTIRPKLPEESESLLEFLHNKSQIHEPSAKVKTAEKQEEVKVETEEEPVETASPETADHKKNLAGRTQAMYKTRDTKEETVQLSKKKMPSNADDEILTVKIIEDEESNSEKAKRYSQRLQKEDLKPYVANSKKLLIKKAQNNAFIPRKK